MKKTLFTVLLACVAGQCLCWGFFAHRLINQYAVFLLPPEMVVFYKPHLHYIFEHAVDADKRRYAVAGEGVRHYIDIDNYGEYPYTSLPRKWTEAIDKFGEEVVIENGIVPWAVQTSLLRLTFAFKNKNLAQILRYSSDLGHYIADAHVPLHASSNHNGQHTDQKGIHGFWESRLPELFADNDFNFFIGKAEYIKDAESYIWDRVKESALAADSVLSFEKLLNKEYKGSKYAFEPRNDAFIRQYSSNYSKEYNHLLNGMVERRMRQSIFAVASFWFTAWVNAGQPDLQELSNQSISESEAVEFVELDKAWKNGKIKGREHED